MGRKPLVNATLLATTALLSTVDPVAVLVDAAVSDGTLEQYNSRIAQLLSFLSALPGTGCRTLTLKLFAAFLLARRDLTNLTHGTSTAEGYRSAILHFQLSRALWLSPDGCCWAADPAAVKLCRGYRYNYKRDSGKRLRGQIDDNMFPSLLEFITLNFPKLQHPTEIAFGVGIRSHALVALLRGSYCPSTRTLTHLSKKANANNGLPFLEDSFVTDERSHLILTQLELRTPLGSLYFPKHEWSLAQWRTAMKQASIALGWPSGLKFDGPHCLRHGAVARLLDELGDETPKAINLSQTMLRHYSKTNEARLRRN